MAWYMSYVRVQSHVRGEIRRQGGAVVDKHPLTWAKEYNAANSDARGFSDVIIPQWWTQDVPADIKDITDFEVER